MTTHETRPPQVPSPELQARIDGTSPELSQRGHESNSGVWEKITGGKFGRLAVAGAIFASAIAGVGSRSEADAAPLPEVATAPAPEIPDTENIETISVAVEMSAHLDGTNSWERNFDLEEGEAESNRVMITQFVKDNAETIRTATANGDKIFVDGFASAEDDGENAGLTETDIANTEGNSNTTLAEARATGATEILIDEINTQLGIDASSAIEISGTEDTWSEQEVAVATELASENGYESVKQMIQAWNRSDSPKTEFSEDIQTFLSETLNNRRGFTMSIETQGTKTYEVRFGEDQEHSSTAEVGNPIQEIQEDEAPPTIPLRHKAYWTTPPRKKPPVKTITPQKFKGNTGHFKKLHPQKQPRPYNGKGKGSDRGGRSHGGNKH